MKKIFITLTGLIFATVFSVVAQQNSSAKLQGATAVKSVNPNVERTRIVNEKIAAERVASGNRTTKVAPTHKNKTIVESTKVANRATLPATAPSSGK